MADDIFEKSIWPCSTPDLFWALSDILDDIAQLSELQDDVVEYHVQDRDLPAGRLGLAKMEALRDLRLDLSQWPSSLARKVKSATLSLGSKALEVVRRRDRTDLGEVLRFTIFTGPHILPLFVVDEPLTVRVDCDFLSDVERTAVPRQVCRATGLLCTIKSTNKPFFVAASSNAILTWDGTQSHVMHTSSARSSHADDSDDDVILPSDSQRDLEVHRDDSTMESLWHSLQR